MKLKKWGSLLTALAMVGSMATYVPATVSAATTTDTATVIKTGIVSDPVYSDTDATFCYELSSKTTGSDPAVTTYTLTISPKVAGSAYVIPEYFLKEVAYALKDDVTNASDNFETVNGICTNLDVLKIVGKAQISQNAFIMAANEAAEGETASYKDVDGSTLTGAESLIKADVSGSQVYIDCLATYDAVEYDVDADGNKTNPSATQVKKYEAVAVTKGTTHSADTYAPSVFQNLGYSPKVAHSMQAVTTYNNHKCGSCGRIDNSYEAHGFTTAEGATVKNGAHTCKCGKSSEAYKSATDGMYYNDAGTPIDIHTWNQDKHECSLCGADMSFAHNKSYTANSDGKTHVAKCVTGNGVTGCGKTLSTAEAHQFPYGKSYNGSADQNAAGKDIDKAWNVTAQKCLLCDAEHTDTQHVYEYSWVADKDGIKFVNVGTTKGNVCACGAKKTHTAGHEFTKAYGYHLCGCGQQESDAAHIYSMCYDENGKLVGAAAGSNMGVICQYCGKVDPTHTTHQTGVINGTFGHVDFEANATFFNKTEHKHFCYCGTEITNTKHVSIISSGKHICALCDKDLSSETADNGGHNYTYVAIDNKVTDTPTNNRDCYLLAENVEYTDSKLVDVSKGVYCECGALEPAHAHEYIYGIGEEHYCLCGAKKAVVSGTEYHDYIVVNTTGVEQADGTTVDNKTTFYQCETCGYVKNHTHTYDANCECVLKACKATNHTFAVENKTHKCQKCGLEDPNAHVYVVDTKTQKHICACGAEGPHDYYDCVCECGDTNHKTDNTSAGVKTVDGKKIHVCVNKLNSNGKDCGYTFTEDENYGHEFDLNDDKCDLCDEVNPNHKHYPSAVQSSQADNKAYDACRCGANIEHVWGLATADWNLYHQCANYKHDVILTDDGKAVKEYKKDDTARCAKTDEHDFTTTDASGNEVTLNFCECGAMNPSVLAKAGLIKATKNGTTITYSANAELDFSKLATQYKTAYIVTLTKAFDAAKAYDITKTINTTASYSKVAVALTEAERAEALASVEEFVTVWEDKDNNQAASSAKIGFVEELDEDGVVSVDHATRGYAAFADGTPNNTGAVYDKVGAKVTIQVKNKPGYTFEGWYSKKTPSATDKPLSTSAAYEVEILDGHYTYYAKFKENAKKTVNFGEGIKYYSGITAPATTWNDTNNNDEVDNSEIVASANWGTGTKGFPETLSFLANEEIIIQADKAYFNTQDKGIAGITDKYGNILEYNVCVEEVTDTTTNNVTITIDEDADPADYNAYKVVLAYDNNFNVSTYSNDSTSIGAGCYVQFQVGGKIVAAKKFTSKDVTAIQPADPMMTGYEFKGWYKSDDATKTIQKLKSVTFDAGVLVPLFEKIDNLTVIVKNGTIDKNSVKETYTYGDKILVTADLQNAAGKYFSGWYDENGTLLSEKRTDYIIVNKSMTITAKYTRDTELVLEAGVDLTYTRTTSALTLVASRYLTDDMTLVEVGTLYAVGKVTDLTIENTELGRKTLSASDVSGKNGNFNVTLNLSSEAAKTSVISARSYFIYEDADGVNHTVYSDAVYADPVN